MGVCLDVSGAGVRLASLCWPQMFESPLKQYLCFISVSANSPYLDILHHVSVHCVLFLNVQ